MSYQSICFTHSLQSHLQIHETEDQASELLRQLVSEEFANMFCRFLLVLHFKQHKKKETIFQQFCGKSIINYMKYLHNFPQKLEHIYSFSVKQAGKVPCKFLQLFSLNFFAGLNHVLVLFGVYEILLFVFQVMEHFPPIHFSNNALNNIYSGF